MENKFVRHEPCFERILFVMTLDRKKMKERILIGDEQQIRFRLDGSKYAEVLCDVTRPLAAPYPPEGYLQGRMFCCRRRS